MAEFEKRPDVVDAEQWDGTVDGAVNIKNFLDRNQLRYRIEVKTVFERDLEPYSLLEIESRDNKRMREDRWVVWGTYQGISGLHILYDDEFQAAFKPKENT